MMITATTRRGTSTGAPKQGERGAALAALPRLRCVPCLCVTSCGTESNLGFRKSAIPLGEIGLFCGTDCACGTSCGACGTDPQLPGKTLGQRRCGLTQLRQHGIVNTPRDGCLAVGAGGRSARHRFPTTPHPHTHPAPIPRTDARRPTKPAALSYLPAIGTRHPPGRRLLCRFNPSPSFPFHSCGPVPRHNMPPNERPRYV